MTPSRTGKVFIETLGCAKNTADSDGIGSVLRGAGYELVDQAEQAQVLIVNTCGFLQASRAESLQELRGLGARKRPGQLLIAAGCLISRYGPQVRREVPAVDGILDAGKWLAMPRLIDYLRQNGSAPEDWLDEAYLGLQPEQRAARSVTLGLPRRSRGPSAYLKIADGCDRPCTFCIIPALKGGHRSKPVEDVLSEARDLAAQGVKELVLVAQDTTAYGWDWGKKDELASLLERLATEVEGIDWIRLMYAYPSHVTPRLIERMTRLPRLLHYLDLPLQHAHPAVLARMKRPNEQVTRRILDDLRTAMPDLALRTTFIVGFPGETEAEFRYLLDFIREQRFDRVGVFEYSAEEGTAAFGLPDQVRPRVRTKRRAAAMALQQEVSYAKQQSFVGKTLQVLVEGTGDGISVGRTYRDAPEVDGVVLLPASAKPGYIVRARVLRATEYDLEAELES